MPLLTTVLTGVAYRISKDWLGLTRDQVHFLMSLHEGEYLGHRFEPVYVMLNGLGLLWMLGTGGAMVLQRFRYFKPSAQSTSIAPLVEKSGGDQAIPQAVKEDISVNSE